MSAAMDAVQAFGRTRETGFTTFFPGSGKSFWADKMLLQGIHVHASDAIRAELLHDENCQDNKQMIFQELGRRVMADLNQGQSCIYDATNISRRKRAGFLKNVPMKSAYDYCVLNGYSYAVQAAAAYHDCGKFFTKKFKNSRGLPAESTH